ncbi:Ig-like domain-containing protein [Hyalangium rubrum]|uniref:Ig-like domain-containing protein n=1 Tax=Hyalangium rubrum TaxID=3103134 RepID=A0ABU5HAF9_9BACT|nr:Ig-like domain-containing protein [Hyalangium sp. s54d21]MDY7230236.1 Ig-like domain-containing protein [Hyalangium sp. s54d21]
MLKRSWLQALCAVVCVLALAGCGGDECTSPTDCRNEKGAPPAGKTYACVENKCELRDAPDTEVKCEPECASGLVCDTSSGTGVCRTCSATAGCTAPLICDVAANNGQGVCKTCTDSTTTGTDLGCASNAPVCDTSGSNGQGVCKTCADSASGTGADQGCSTSTPICDATANSGAGVCKACFDTASGTGQDLGCSATSPVCDPTSANGVGACKTCTDTAQGTDTDLGCSDTAPICNTTASGGRGACRACVDSLTGTDLGCSDTAPICDTSGSSGVGVCKTCTDSATGTGTDQGCSATTPICNPDANSGSGVCKVCATSATGGTDVGCSATTPVCDLDANNGAGACRLCADTATGAATDTGCSATSPLCAPTANNGAGACRVCMNTVGPDESGTDVGCFAPTSICDTAAANGAGVCKVCLGAEGCPGAQTCNATGTACEGCEGDASCTNPSTPICKPPPPVSTCVECVENANCTTATRPACNATNFCGCTDDDQCLAAAGNTDFCDLTANNSRGECKVCLTDANCHSVDQNKPYCDSQTACIQCRTTADCALTQVCNTTLKACEAAPGADPATTSAQIAAFIAADPIVYDPGLPIENAFVTYIKPAVGADAAGFFLQAEANGPAMFVETDPSALQVGDRVTISVTQKSLRSGIDAATTLAAAPTIVSRGHPVQNLNTATPAGLAVDHSAKADTEFTVEANLNQYESELVSFTGTLGTGPSSLGTGHVGFQFTTTGITTGNNNVRLRVATTVSDQYEMVSGCQFTLKAGPMWRFTPSATSNAAQPSAYYASDLSVSCPGPKLLSALPSSLTQVVLTFDRRIDPNSITDAATQFIFETGLTTTDAQVNERQVTLTTSTQTPGTTYNLTVANTIKDTVGTPVQADADTATFKGYRVPAVLRITEVQPTMTGNADLVELVVVTGGNVENFTLNQDVNAPTLLATFPDATVAAGDIIVVHMNTPSMTSETTGKTQFPSSGTATNYDTAWDFKGGTNHITYSSRVLVIRDAVSNIQDATPFIRTEGTPPAAFAGNLQAIQAAGHWSPVDCGGVPCTLTSTPTALEVSADWTGLPTSNSTTATNSVRRVSATDTNSKADWATGAPTWGVINP